MIARGTWKTAGYLLALALVSALIGGLLGRRLARSEFEHRSDLAHWNETAMRAIDRHIKPTPQQRQKIQARVDSAVEELLQVRAATLERSTQIVLRLIDQVEQELDSQQRAEFAKIRPQRENLSTLNLLNVDPRKK